MTPLSPSVVALYAARPGACRARVTAVLFAIGALASQCPGWTPNYALSVVARMAAEHGWDRNTHRAIQAGIVSMARGVDG